MDSVAKPEPAQVGRETVLDVLNDLWRHLDDVDLDTIDGEFYWRCCRPEVVRDLEESRAVFKEILRRRRVVGNLPKGGEEAQMFRRAYYDLLDRYAGELPWIQDILFGGVRFRMRDAYLVRAGTRAYSPFLPSFVHGHETHVQMLVFSSAWTGENVEKRLRDYIDGPWITEQERLGFEPDPPRPANSVTVRIAFDFRDGEESMKSHVLGTQVSATHPHVFVSVALPFPPQGVIAALYNGIVVAEKRWDQRLRGVANVQGRRVTIRTWAIGLLVASGATTTDSIFDVFSAMGQHGSISSQQFNQDRLRLIERVPEAETYLRIRPARR